MKFNLLFSVVLAASFLANLKEQSDSLFKNTLEQYKKLVKSVKAKAELLKERITGKGKNAPNVEQVAEDEEEPNSEQIREFLEQITKHFQEIQKKREAEELKEKEEETAEKTEEKKEQQEPVAEEVL